MVSFSNIFPFATLALVAFSYPVVDEKRDLASAIATDINSGIATVESTFATAIGNLISSTSNLTALENDAVCIFENFAGISTAPHTNGIEWWEDAVFITNLILTSAVAEYAENKTTAAIQEFISEIEQDQTDLIYKIASVLGVDGSFAAAVGLKIDDFLVKLITAIVKSIVASAEKVAEAPSTAYTIDLLINEAIKEAEVTLLSSFEYASTFCSAGAILFTGLTAFEACTFDVDSASQVLSEVRNLFENCS